MLELFGLCVCCGGFTRAHSLCSPIGFSACRRVGRKGRSRRNYGPRPARGVSAGADRAARAVQICGRRSAWSLCGDKWPTRRRQETRRGPGRCGLKRGFVALQRKKRPKTDYEDKRERLRSCKARSEEKREELDTNDSAPSVATGAARTCRVPPDRLRRPRWVFGRQGGDPSPGRGRLTS